MTLELDDRQRAMLQEMGVKVWLPEAASPPVRHAPKIPIADPLAAIAIAAAAATLTRLTAGSGAVPASKHVASIAMTHGEPLDLQGMDWPTLAQTAAACQACGLCAGRKNSTLQASPTAAQADWMVVGDPPDEDEDRLGQPFAEQTGVLLDNMLKAVGASRTGTGRQGAYLSNVVKCRPPQGRLPQAPELAQCAQYLQREIALVQPKVILAMGRFAAQLLLGEHPEHAALPLGKQRGQVYHYQGIPVVVTYHPKVLLRASADKAKAWADLCLAMDVLEGAKGAA